MTNDHGGDLKTIANEKSVELISQTFDLLKIGSWTYNLQSGEVTWTKNLYQIFDVPLSTESLNINHYLARIPTDEIGYIKDSLRLCITDGIEYDTRHKIIMDDGSYKIIHAVVRAQRDENQQIGYLYGIAQDVTEEIIRDQQTRLNNNLLNTIFTEFGDALFLTDTKSRKILQVNAKAVELFELSNIEEFKGKFGPDFHKIPWDEKDFISLNEALTKFNYWESEIEYRTAKGNYFWGAITIKRIQIDDKTYELVRVADISKKKSIENQLIQSQKLESLGMLAGGVAHDFNNLLTMIIGTAELILKSVDPKPEVQSYVNRIIEASDRGSSIAKQLLYFSRPELIELRPISATHVLEQVSELINQLFPKNIQMKVVSQMENNMILGDSGQLFQVILNLAINSRDAMPNGGTLTIKSSNLETTIFHPNEESRPYLLIQIIDTGMGMTEDVIRKIFNPFFTTKEKGKGTGLGMSIVHSIMQHHQGHIDVMSTVGKGTTVSLYFPTITNVIEINFKYSKPNKGNGEGILIVDDEPLIRETLKDQFNDFGFSTFSASNGREAIQAMKLYSDKIDIVVTDLGMPVMGGVELAKSLLKTKPSLCVVITSGFIEKEEKEELLKIGVKKILNKPYRIAELVESIHEHFSNN